VARGWAAASLRLGVAARHEEEKLGPLGADIGAESFPVDASDPAAVARLFGNVGRDFRPAIEKVVSDTLFLGRRDRRDRPL